MPTSLDESWEIIPPVPPTPAEEHHRTIVVILLIISALLLTAAVAVGVIIGRGGNQPAPPPTVDLTKAVSICHTGVTSTDARFKVVDGAIVIDTLSPDKYSYGELGCVLKQVGTSTGLGTLIANSIYVVGVHHQTQGGLSYVWSVHPGVWGANVMDITINQEVK